MSKGRIDKLDMAIRSLQQRKIAEQRAIDEGKGLPLEYRTLPCGARISMYVTTADEALAVQDQLLGLAGANMLVNGHSFPGWLTPQEEADRDREFSEAGFVKDDNGLWAMPSVAAEIAFLRAWLAEADAVGRRVSDRDGIEGWISYLVGNATVAAPVVIDGPVEPLPGLQEHVPSADESRARQLRRQEGGVGLPRSTGSTQAALARRRNRLNH